MSHSDIDWHIRVQDDYSYLSALTAELFFTAQFILVYLTIQERLELNLLVGFLNASANYACFLAVQHISGGCLNPTVCIVINSVKSVHNTD